MHSNGPQEQVSPAGHVGKRKGTSTYSTCTHHTAAICITLSFRKPHQHCCFRDEDKIQVRWFIESESWGRPLLAFIILHAAKWQPTSTYFPCTHHVDLFINTGTDRMHDPVGGLTLGRSCKSFRHRNTLSPFNYYEHPRKAGAHKREAGGSPKRSYKWAAKELQATNLNWSEIMTSWWSTLSYQELGRNFIVWSRVLISS